MSKIIDADGEGTSTLSLVPVKVEPSAHIPADIGAVIPSVKGRKIAYAVYALIALVVGNTAVGLAAANIDQPVWLVIASAIVANLAAPFSAIAIANAKAE
jgi:hypothetical protein